KKPTGELHAIDYEALTIDLKRGPKLADAPHPTALAPYDIINAQAMRESLLQLGNWVADHAIEGDGIYAAARELLLRRVPRLKESTLADFGNSGTGVSPVSHAQDARATSRLLDFEHSFSLEAAKQIALVLDRTVLPI